MPEYRFYRVAQSGHIHAPPVSVEAANDAAALKLAREQLSGGDIEVWRDTRLVAYLTPEPNSAVSVARPESDQAPQV